VPRLFSVISTIIYSHATSYSQLQYEVDTLSVA